MQTAGETAANTAHSSMSRSDTTARLFSWLMLAYLVVYLLNNTLVHALRWPGVRAAFDSPFDWRAWAQIALYVAAAVLVLQFVRNKQRSLRAEAATITAINTYLIRSLFWAVLFIGLADMAISFVRVEGFLPSLVNEQLAKDLARSH